MNYEDLSILVIEGSLDCDPNDVDKYIQCAWNQRETYKQVLCADLDKETYLYFWNKFKIITVSLLKMYNMRKVYHLEKDSLHYYYGSLQAVFNAHNDLGVSKGTLDRYDWSKGEYVNEQIKLRVGNLLSASECLK